MSSAKWVNKRTLEHLLAACTLENELALRVSMTYGMRIGDVLRLPSAALQKGVWSFREEKTGKRRRVTLSASLQRELQLIAGKVYVFEHRLDWRKHRTRQAVWKDLKRVARAFRLGGVSPHTARKVYAVARYAEDFNADRVRRLLNHTDEAVTYLYALADVLNAQKVKPTLQQPPGGGGEREGGGRKSTPDPEAGREG